MYDNIGSKIKTLAKVVFVIMAILSVILGIVVAATAVEDYNEEKAPLGLLIAGIGILLSWVGTFFLYGFGQLIENSDILVREAKKQSNGIQKISTESTSNTSSATNTTVGTSKFAQMNFKSTQPAQATPTTHTINFTQSSTTATNFKRCPHCGERVTSRTCDVCGRDNNLF